MNFSPRERHHWLIKNRRRGFYHWLRITAVSQRYADVSLVNTYVPVTCVLSAFNTQLAHNRVFARVRGESARRLRASLRSRPFTASSRVHSLSLSLSSLFPTHVSLFLAFLVPPQYSLFLVLYVYYTNNSSSVSTETSLPVSRPSHFLLFFFLPLSLSFFPCPPNIHPLISFSFSSLVAVLSPLSEPASVSKFYFKRSYPRASPLLLKSSLYPVLCTRRKMSRKIALHLLAVRQWQWECVRVGWGVTMIREPPLLAAFVIRC